MGDGTIPTFYDDAYNKLIADVCELFALPKMSYTDSNEKVRTFVEWAISHRKKMFQYGYDPKNWDPLYIIALTDALDTDTATEWYNFAKAKKMKLATLLNFLKFRRPPETPSPVPSISQGNHKQKEQIQCFFCGKTHVSIFACPAFKLLSKEKQVQILRENNRCFKCFEIRSKTHNCTIANCNFCGKQHNVRVCFHTNNKKKNNKKKNVQLKNKNKYGDSAQYGN